jgi:hypothetical protein
VAQFMFSVSLVVTLLVPLPAFGFSFIDSPLPHSVQSGTVAPPHGWICPRNGAITAQVDGGPIINFTEDQNRQDTAGPCDNSGNNSFVITQPWNWNVFGDGQHTILFFDNGQQFASRTFEIATFGTEYLSGPTASCTVQDFPDPGTDVEVSWDEAIQNFRITQVTESGPPPIGPEALLGTWQFSYTQMTSTFTDEFTLDTLTSAAGPLVATGEDALGNFAVGGLIQDISPDTALPFDFGVFWKGILLCTLHVFSLTSETSAEGVVSLSTVQGDGKCGPNVNGVDDATVGLRIQAPQQALSHDDGAATEQAKLLLVGKSAPLSPETQQEITQLIEAFEVLR